MYSVSRTGWAVKIHTGTSINRSSVGMVDGVMYFTTGGYDGVGGIYEDGTQVEQGVWCGDLLHRKAPIESMVTGVNIEDGGDYSYLSNAKLKFVNATLLGGSLSTELLGDLGLPLVGYRVEVFVVINDVFISQWVGSIGDYEVGDRVFKIKLKDSNDDEKETHKKTAFGHVEKVPLVTDVQKTDNVPILSCPVTRYTPADYGYVASFGMSNVWATASDLGSGEDIKASGSGTHAVTGVPKYKLVIQRNELVTSDLVMVVSKGGTESQKVEIDSVSHTRDKYGNYVTEIEHTGYVGLADQSDLFGNWESLELSYTYDNLHSFNGTLVKFYKNVVTIDESVNTDKITKIYSENGTELPLDSIDGKVVKSHIVASKKIPINRNDVKWGKSNTAGIIDLIGNADEVFPWVYNGEYDLETDQSSGEFFTKTLIDCSSALSQIDIDKWSSVTLGIDVQNSYRNSTLKTFLVGDTWAMAIPMGIYQQTVDWVWRRKSTSGDYVDGVTVVNSNDPTSNKTAIENTLWDGYMVTVYPIYNDVKYGIISYDTAITAEYVLPNARYWTVGNSQYDFTQLQSSNQHYGDVLDQSFRPVNGVAIFENPIEKSLFEATISESTNCAPNIKATLKDSPLLGVEATMGYCSDTDWYVCDYLGRFGEVYTKSASDSAYGRALVDYSLYCYSEVDAGEGIYGTITDNETTNVKSLIEKLVPTADVSQIGDREQWEVSRFVDGQTSNRKLLTETCKQAFLMGYTDRFGTPVFKAYRDSADIAVEHNSSSLIVKGSLKPIKSTKSSRIYNELEVFFGFDNVLGEYKEQITVNHITEEEFPPQRQRNWGEFVTGVDYDTAKRLWQACRKGFVDTGINNDMSTLDKELTMGGSARITEKSFGVRAIEEKSTWITGVRGTVEYDIPITQETAVLSVGDNVLFSDPIMTDGDKVLGWVTKKGVNSKEMNYPIQLTFGPDAMSSMAELEIIEAVGNTDEIIEQSSNADEYIEH